MKKLRPETLLKMAGRSLRTGALLLPMAMAIPAQAQFTLNCPNLPVQPAGSACDAVVNYQTPWITGGATSDTTYTHTGAPQIYIVPPGVGQVTIEAWGAQGNTNAAAAVQGGNGGYATGTLAVTPGETLHVYVGGGGITSIAGGFNGGGNAGSTLNCATASGGGGGGASDVRQGGQALANRVIVAGGGGGAAGNRIQACGRGAGGGGGGGYYGGGGGAGWPSATGGTAPTGGSQSAGGTGGITTSTAGATNGGPGALGIGGLGGNESGSNQAGAGTAAAGGFGAGLVGGPGSFNAAQNWTGQSGAGGSGYIGGVTSASMQDGVRTGPGAVRIVAPVNTVLNQIAGLPAGSTFPIGTTTNTFTVQQGVASDTCTFDVTVADLTPPSMNCPPTQTYTLDSLCGANVPNFVPNLALADNCDPNPSAVQVPAVGSVFSQASPMVTITASDATGNIDTCTFTVVLIDNIAPWIVSCPAVVNVVPTTLNCQLPVNFALPIFDDNCGFYIVGSHQPGDIFSAGGTVVTYQAFDSSGNFATCGFVVNIAPPALDNIISPEPACIGDPFTLNAAPGYASYNWSTGATSTSITSNTPGLFWVEISNASGCIGRDSFVYAYPAPPAPVITAVGPTICTGNFATYQWYLNGNLIPGATSQCYHQPLSGNYSVVVTDSIGCQGISPSSFFVGVSEALSAAMEVWPVPAREQVQVRMGAGMSGPATLRVTDLAGRTLIQASTDDAEATQVLDLRALPAGTYLISIESEQGRALRRFSHID